jgi:hypothetical protein
VEHPSHIWGTSDHQLSSSGISLNMLAVSHDLLSTGSVFQHLALASSIFYPTHHCKRLSTRQCSPLLSLFFKWYALRTEKSPFTVPLHSKISSLFVLLRGMDRIFLTSSGEKICSSKLIFHHFLSLSISSHTLADGAKIARGDCTLYAVGVGSHLSSQIRIFAPFPTLHTRPFRISPLKLCMLLHAKDGFFPIVASRTEQLGKYFPFMILAVRLSGVFLQIDLEEISFDLL